MTKGCSNARACRSSGPIAKRASRRRPTSTSPARKGSIPFSSHGKLLEQGQADMYNACEWGNYCRVQDTRVGSRQVGRRGIVTYAAIVVRPDSPVYTAQQLAGRTVGVPFYFGTHYLALHLLEGFLPREQIKVCRAPNGSRYRFDAMMQGEHRGDDADRALSYAGREEGLPARSARPSITAPRSPPTGSMPRPMARSTARCARRCAHQRQQDAPISITSSTTTKRRTPRSARCKPQDIRESRIVVCDPAPIPRRRDAAHLRVAEELGHAGGDRLAARARQHARANACACGGGVTSSSHARTLHVESQFRSKHCCARISCPKTRQLLRDRSSAAGCACTAPF